MSLDTLNALRPLLFVVAVAMNFCAPAAFAQDRSEPRRSDAPLTIYDSRTGKVLDPSEIIELTFPADSDHPQGRTFRIRAGDWAKILSDHERELNAHGMSLQSLEGGKREAAKPNVSALAAQEQLIRQSHNPAHREPHTHRDAATPADDKSGLNKRQDWIFRYGDTEVFASAALAAVELNANDRQAFAHAFGKFEVGLLGQSFEVMQAKATLTAPGTGDATGLLNVRLLNRDVYVKNLQSPRWEKADSFHLPFDTSYPQHFMIGPIPTTLKVGARGDASISYKVSAGILAAQASLTPQVQSDAYAQIGTDLVIAGASVEGSLLLIDETLNLTGDAGFAIDENGEPIARIALEGKNKLETLSGRISGLGFLWVPKPWPPWRDMLKFERELFAWEGFTIEGSIFAYQASLSRQGLIVAE